MSGGGHITEDREAVEIESGAGKRGSKMVVIANHSEWGVCARKDSWDQRGQVEQRVWCGGGCKSREVRTKQEEGRLYINPGSELFLRLTKEEGSPWADPS